jgi:hypothetical protein
VSRRLVVPLLGAIAGTFGLGALFFAPAVAGLDLVLAIRPQVLDEGLRHRQVEEPLMIG